MSNRDRDEDLAGLLRPEDRKATLSGQSRQAPAGAADPNVPPTSAEDDRPRFDWDDEQAPIPPQPAIEKDDSAADRAVNASVGLIYLISNLFWSALLGVAGYALVFTSASLPMKALGVGCLLYAVHGLGHNVLRLW